MLNFKKNTLLILGLSLFISLKIFGQAAQTPFSYLGIGEYYGNALAHNQGMAGVGISNPQYFYLNNQNPALLVFNRFTSFEAGFIGERRTVIGNGVSETNGNANLNYLIMGFPIKVGRWATSLGLAPYTTVNYRLNYTDSILGSANTVDVIESGSGGINQFAWSHGVSLNKNLSLGVKAAYLFSSIENEYSNSLTQSAQAVTYYPTVYERTYVKDFLFTSGLSYHVDSLFNKNYKFNLGVVYDFKTDLKTQYTARFEQRNDVDTLFSTSVANNEPGSINLPAKLALGLSFGKGDHWVIGSDFVLLDYTQFSGREVSQEATKGWKLALGTEFTPDVVALGSYLKRITYRTGVSYDKYPYLINGVPLKDFGINFGFSMPVSRVSSLDFAFKVGKRGNVKDNTIEENYFKFYFGATFNDQWFVRRRFD
jgi:hypothetical protein